MRGRSDEVQKKRLITALVGAAVILGLLYVYQGSIFGSQSSGAAALEYGSKSLRKLGWGGDDDADETPYKFSLDDADDGIMLKSFPGYALIECEKYEEVQAAIKTMNGANMLEKPINVDWAFCDGPYWRRGNRRRISNLIT